MPYVAVGVEHTRTPLDFRERMALDATQRDALAGRLLDQGSIDEVFVLSTCNRTELYLYAADARAGAGAGRDTLLDSHPEIEPYLQIWEEDAAIEHLFRVASGLESQVPGEPQILGQVREALDEAQDGKTVGPHLHALVRAAIRCARHARAETSLGTVNPSLGEAAIALAEREMGGLGDTRVLVVGGGEMARLLVEVVSDKHPAEILVANRTPEAVASLAEGVGARVLPLADLAAIAPEVDLLITATTARHYLLTPSDFAETRRKPLCVIDLAIPRDVDPAVGTLPGVHLFDLESLVPAGRPPEWEKDVARMEAIIAAEMRDFMAWEMTRRVAPVIANLRSHVEAVQRQELERVAPQLSGLTEREREAVERLTGRLVDKMFHHLVVRLRLAAQTDRKLVEAAEFFFLHGDGGLFPHAADEDPAMPRHATGGREEE